LESRNGTGESGGGLIKEEKGQKKPAKPQKNALIFSQIAGCEGVKRAVGGGPNGVEG